ncbi:MAG: NBR1-Ig-like domain-containing protein, partial [Anaerolineales bacterium]
MLVRKILAVILLVGILFSHSQPITAAAESCDAVELLADVSVPDGSAFAPNATFVKTWRLKNAGSCTWSTGYNLVFFNGDQMGAPVITSLPAQVAPDQSLDISVNMTAPGVSGHYRGYWKLSNASGVLFGIGSSASDSFWVDINVIETSAVVFDFVDNAPYAQWKSGAGPLQFSGTSGDRRGYAFRIENPHLEDGSTASLPGLLTVPQNKYNGYIQATYPEFLVQQGDHLQTLVNCEFGAIGCYVTFRVDYMMPNGYIGTLWKFKEAHEGLFYRADIDLSGLAGQRVKFILMVLATGYASKDRAIWGAPRIVRTGSLQPPAPPATLTPLPPLTPTATPFGTPPPISSRECDRASFVMDVTIPDGTLFSPGASFIKTWRLKNTGWCYWTKSYSLVFYSGEQMGAPTVINLPWVVVPGAGIDLTVDMVAPATPGKYRGFWILSNASGELFGIGQNADDPFWAEITVTGDSPTSPGGYDFVANMCSAQWKSAAGVLACPGTDGDRNGFVLRQDSAVLEDGTSATNPSLLVAPHYRYNGYIQGFYPTFTVQPGDHFHAAVGCEHATNCNVDFRLNYMTDTGWIGTLWTGQERNDGRQFVVDVDLTPLAGRSVRFVLTLLANGYAINDRAIWSAPYISRAGGPPAPATQTPTAPPTQTQTQTPTLTLSPYPTVPVGEWPIYTNTKYGFQFRYPPDGQITIEMEGAAHILLPIEPGTNLKEKYLDVMVTENVDPCRSPLPSGPMNTSEIVTLNGITFLKETGEDGATGSYYKWTAYSTQRDNVCVSLDFILHSLNPGVFSTPPPLYNEELESAVFAVIASTYTWLAPAPTFTPTMTPTPTATSTPTLPPVYNWPTYNNYKYGFEFKYPPEGQIADSSNDNVVIISLPFQKGTNLSSKYLDLRVFEDVSSCAHPIVGSPMNPESVVFNGITFLKGTGTEGGVGQIRDWVTYTTVRGNVCVALLFVLHSTNPGNYVTPIPIYDQAAESAVFQEMMQTFSWPYYSPSVTDTPTPTATMQPDLTGPYGVTFVGYSDALNIRSGAGASNPVIGLFARNAINVMRTGPVQHVDGAEWVEVLLPNGVDKGWVNSYYLTEYVTHETFCADTRISVITGQLKQAVNQSDGNLFASIVSPLHGANIDFWRNGTTV